MHSCHSCKSHQNVVLIFLGCGGKWRLGNHTGLPRYWEEGQRLHFALFQHRPMFHHRAKSILTNEKDHTLIHCLHCLLHSFFYHHGLWADAEINLHLCYIYMAKSQSSLGFGIRILLVSKENEPELTECLLRQNTFVVGWRFTKTNVHKQRF